MTRDVHAIALGTSLADPKDIGPRVKSSFFFAEDGARGYVEIANQMGQRHVPRLHDTKNENTIA